MKVVKHSLVDSAVGKIRTLIEKRELRAGDRLPTEPELAADFGISRTVLREAIGRLEAIGLLDIQHGRGMFVSDGEALSNCARLLRSAMTITPRDWLQFAEFRAMLECNAARLAAKNGAAEDFDALDEILRQMDRPDAPYMDGVRQDCRFHQKIAEMSGNELIKNTMTVMQEFVIAGMVQTTHDPRDYAGSQRLHGKLAAAVRSGDPDKAEAAMREHMVLVDQALRRALHTNGAEVKNGK